MADVKDLKNRGIPLKIDGTTRFVKGATKYTTCSDVIKMVLKKTGISKEYRHLFAIFEISENGEQAISGKIRILKVMQGWDSERNKFVLRKNDPLGNLSNSASGMKKCEMKKCQMKCRPTRGIPATDPECASSFNTAARLASFHERQSEKLTKHSEVRGNEITDSTSESDSSLEEFIAKIDHSKMAGFIEFFNAITMRETSKASRKASHESTTTDSDIDKPSKPEHRNVAGKPFSRYSNLRRAHKQFKRHRNELNDKHPKKIHSIRTVEYGLVDDFHAIKTSQRVTQINDLSPKHGPSIKTPKKIGNTFLIKKYFATTHNISRNLKAISKSKTRHMSDTSEEDNANVCCYKYTDTATYGMVKTCKEIWDENLITEDDSGHDDITDSDLESAFVENDDRDICYREHDPTEEYRISANVLAQKDILHKLVDYSVTDDDFSDSDVDDDDSSDNNSGRGKIESDYADDENSAVSFENRMTPLDTNYDIEECYSNGGFCDIQNESYNAFKPRDTSKAAETDKLNISKMSDYIRGIFGRKRLVSEDEEMDSFMKSKIYDDSSSDDGLGSLGSDSEKDVRV